MSALLNFSEERWRSDPAMRIEDAYKWLFHATQGGEHAITSADGPRRWLEREWKTLTAAAPDEPLIESLRPDGKLVRLHLRPYRTQGGTPEPLLSAFVASAQKFKPDKSAFRALWNELGAQLRSGSRNALTRAAWERLDYETADQKYPAIEHSENYLKARIPAYRVLTGDAAKRLVELRVA